MRPEPHLRFDPGAMLARFDDQARAQIAEEPGIHVERDGETVRISGLWDCVVWSRLTDETAGAAIAREKTVTAWTWQAEDGAARPERLTD